MLQLVRAYWIVLAGKVSLEITHTETVPETDTGGLVEYTKALERMTLKELGNIASVTSG